jgi:glycosyltransferase involved in cell wall biosynthesis
VQDRKNVLLISYDFPPIGGGGIQRNVKYLKYLSRLNWDTNVLTVKERDFYVFDYSLLNEIKDTTIHRSSSVDPLSVSFKLKKIFRRKARGEGNNKPNGSSINESAWYVSLYRFLRDWIIFPDSYGGWIPFAYNKGKEIISNKKPDVIFITFPYPSNALVGYLLHLKFDIPYVIDFRDAWLDDPYVKFTWWFHRKLHTYLEKKLLTSANRVIVYGQPLQDIFEEKYPNLKGKISIITNGFDPEDFENLNPVKKENNKIRIVYSGAVYVDRREVFVNFVKAVEKLSLGDRSKIEIIFVGDKLPWANDLVKDCKLEETITFTGYLNHLDALNYLSSADIALMFLKIGDVVAYTGKIFEYLGLGLPVMACVEKSGACSQLLASINHDQGVVSPSDSDAIAAKLKEIAGKGLPKLDTEKAKIFSRKYHTSILNEILREI